MLSTEPNQQEVAMGLARKNDGWHISEALWQRMEPLLPPGKPHPLGYHNPRVPDRAAMNAILFVLRKRPPSTRIENQDPVWLSH